MGCDIHAHLEIKIEDKWEHYSVIEIDRNYTLFAMMAGVRGDYIPISEPKGLPDNISVITSLDCEVWGTDGHNHSWLSSKELEKLRREFEHYFETGFIKWLDTFGYLFGESIDNNDWLLDVTKGIATDVRLVFWFDN